MPLFVRISATEWMEWTNLPSWDLAQSKQLAVLLADAGVDLLDVSSAGNNPKQQIKLQPYYQIDLAGAIREDLRKQGRTMAVGAVGMIRDAEMAKGVVEEGEGKKSAPADLVFVARQFLREPEFVLKSAAQLGVAVAAPLQYRRAPIKANKL